MEYGLSEEEVKTNIKFLSDRGANIKYGLIKEGFMRLACYAHIIHNLVSYMLDEPNVHEIVLKCSKLSSYFKNSGLNTQMPTSLKRHVPTRWNSVFTMLEAIIENYQQVYDLLLTKQRLMNEVRRRINHQPDNDLTDLCSALNLEELIQIRDFLKPFKVRFNH